MVGGVDKCQCIGQFARILGNNICQWGVAANLFAIVFHYQLRHMGLLWLCIHHAQKALKLALPPQQRGKHKAFMAWQGLPVGYFVVK